MTTTLSWLDPIGACLALICTYYFTQARRFAWILGIITLFINAVLYWQKGIYGRVGLEALYFISMIYGLYHWGHSKTPENTRPIRYLDYRAMIGYGALTLACIVALSQLLVHYTDSTIPYWDASSTILSLLAQWLLCRKIIHCWIVWFVVDAMVAAMQCYKGIPFHSAVHWLYLGMAVIGYVRWLSLYKMQTHTQPKKGVNLHEAFLPLASH